MTERPVQPTDDIVRKQLEASDPEASVWVAANAGSGKTHVLTQRVLRLLLTGVAPEAILCLTYTKAAAAEMRARVSAKLGEWALMSDTELHAALQDLEKTPPGAAQLGRARTLFALALETPGGLKINTIHAFCESVLHRFPLEAQVPFGFQVIEDAQRADLIRHARERTVADGLEGKGPLVSVLDKVFSLLSDSQIDAAISEALSSMRSLRPILASRAGAKQILRDFVGYDGTQSSADIRRQIETETCLVPGDCRELIAMLDGDPGKSRRFVDLIARAQNPDRLTFEEMYAAFFTGNGAPRAGLMPQNAIKAAPSLHERFLAEQARFAQLCERLTSATLVERSEAVLDLIAAIVDDYERQKRARSLLDFDDLIDRTMALLGSAEQAAWVRYKLDAGIAHILVDESQDTNFEQWSVVNQLADEFFDGADAAGPVRTLFAVGDQKQSIFSFQGAQPRLFGETGRAYAKKARNVARIWRQIDLKASFRTLPAILNAVDLVFDDPARAAALLSGDSAIAHESARTHTGGVVALWPLVQQQPVDAHTDNWPLPDDVTGVKSAARENAEKIVATIDTWLKSKRPVGARARAIRPDDILILVQARNLGFKEIIRALKRAEIPSPGADRLAVSNHIAVMDLLTLGDVLLNPADDLGLAALLRSPLFEVTEDNLFDLAHGRSGTLWQALRESSAPYAVNAYSQLHDWRSRLDFERPYEFFANVLYGQGGLRRFHARLGEEVDDVLSEFLDLALDHERAEQPSLQGFLAQMRSRDISIKRELAEAGGGVRVMTVHGAKGLEAPIVILADAASKPQGSQTRRSVYFEESPKGEFFVHASAARDHVAATTPLLEGEQTAQSEEYWRKLYVAMTRAEDELHVCGTLSAKGKADGSWYNAIAAALADQTCAHDLSDKITADIYPANYVAPAPLADHATPKPEQRTTLSFDPLPEPQTRKILTPSSASAHDQATTDSFQTYGEALREAPYDADQARREGIAQHALLQHLGRVPEADRPHVAKLAMQALLPESPTRHALLIEKIERILTNPAFADLFGPQSRAEVPILANARRGKELIKIAGRIDRLIISAGTITIVDYKSDANPPPTAADISTAYVTQLALYAVVLKDLYPAHEILAAILWTTSEFLMPIPPSLLHVTVPDIILA